MGCCSTRNSFINNTVKKTLASFIENSKLNCFKCSEIKRLDAQILTGELDRPAYELLARGWGIQASFEMFSVKGKVHKFELKTSLLLFSKDDYEKKEALFFEIIGDNKRNLMRFLEWRFQLINEKIPGELCRLDCLDRIEGKEWVEECRFRAGQEIIPLCERIINDSRIVCSLNLLYL